MPTTRRSEVRPPVAPTIQIRSSKPRPASKPHSTPTELARKVLPYYDYGPLLSHHGVYNFLVGGRGLGKSYGAKKRALRRNIDKGELFIYLRRFTEELGMARDTFFADIAHEFPQWDFRANGNKFEKAPASTRDARKREWELIGYAVALSTAQKMKSVAFSRVKTIIFDEFIIEKGLQRYLPDEPKVFNNFYSTVDRWMDKTTVFFLANAVSLMCPYLIEYNLLPTDDTPEFMKVMDGFIVAHFPKAEDFANQALATRFGQFIQGTEYADYAVGNVFADNNADLVDIKPSSADYMCTLETRTGTFSIWWDIDADLYYAQRKRPGNEKFYTLMPEKMTEDKILLLHNDLILGRLRMAFRTAKIMFDTPATRNMFVDVFRRKT